MKEHDETKVCKECGEEKAISEFSKNNHMRDNRLNSCKDCRRPTNRKLYNDWRSRNKKKVRETNKRWKEENPEKYKASQTKYRLNNKDKIKEYHQRKYQEEPHKALARTAISRGIRNGKITRQPCEICGNEEAEAHHEDYSKRLDVVWLCVKHHRRLHSVNK